MSGVSCKYFIYFQSLFNILKSIKLAIYPETPLNLGILTFVWNLFWQFQLIYSWRFGVSSKRVAAESQLIHSQRL